VLVLDANILMRAVLGKQARALLAKYGERVEFVAPDFAFDEALKRLPQVIEGRKLTTAPFMAYFDSLANIVQTVDLEAYSSFEAVARQRLARRDENDWPILAAALACDARFGPKTPISLGAAWRPGRRTGLSCTCLTWHPDGGYPAFIRLAG
jgi:predicted nucleic acid-binding protein